MYAYIYVFYFENAMVWNTLLLFKVTSLRYNLYTINFTQK